MRGGPVAVRAARVCVGVVPAVVRACAYAGVRACVCASACVRASVCERACVYVGVRARACVLVRVCSRAVCGRCVSV